MTARRWTVSWSTARPRRRLPCTGRFGDDRQLFGASLPPTPPTRLQSRALGLTRTRCEASMVTPDVYPRPVCAEKNAVMSTARFLLIYEERLCRRARPAAASRARSKRPRRGRCGSRAGAAFSSRSRLWCTPGGAGGHNPLARAEMRLSVCGTCGGTSAVTCPWSVLVYLAYFSCRLVRPVLWNVCLHIIATRHLRGRIE
jgi:hypothetical protein